MIGRDPSRWRLDPLGNPVLNYLRGCMGQFCHEYDHIIPHSKGGETALVNCQILQTKLNRVKSNRSDITFDELKKVSPTRSFSDYEMDILEKAIYGDLRKFSLEDQVNYEAKRSQETKK